MLPNLVEDVDTGKQDKTTFYETILIKKKDNQGLKFSQDKNLLLEFIAKKIKRYKNFKK